METALHLLGSLKRVFSELRVKKVVYAVRTQPFWIMDTNIAAISRGRRE